MLIYSHFKIFIFIHAIRVFAVIEAIFDADDLLDEIDFTRYQIS